MSAQVALSSDEKGQKFKFSRKLKVFCLTFYLATGPLELLSISFLVGDEELACEDLLVR